MLKLYQCYHCHQHNSWRSDPCLERVAVVQCYPVFIPCISQFQDQVIGFIKDCIALTMDEAKANLNNEQLGFYKKILTQKRKEIKEKIEKEMNLVENH